MARPVGSKNLKQITLVFTSVDNRNYYIRTELPADAEYSVHSLPSLFKPGLTWFYLRITVPNPVE